MKTLFKLILAACLELRNPEPWGPPAACTNPLSAGSGSPTGNEIKMVFQGRKLSNKQDFAQEKEPNCKIVSNEWYV